MTISLTGTEVLYVVPVAANGALAASEQPTTTAAIAALAQASQLPPVKNTAITTVGNGTLTAAAIVGGVITRSGPSADFSDATDTAVAIVAALSAYVANESSVLRIKNTTLFTQTLTAGVGVTLTGTAVIPENTIASYLVTITSATAVTLLYLGSASLANSVGAIGDIMLGNGLALKTDTTTAHTAVLQAYDVDGTAYKTFATLTNGNTPSLAIAAPSGGTVAIDGATIGATTQAAGSFTNATATGYFLRSVGNALTAVGTNRATALQLAKEVNNITTAGASTGVILPVGVIGMRITVFNAGANAIQVYATASETIDTVAGATGVPLTNTKRADFFFTAANTWVSAQLGVVSA